MSQQISDEKLLANVNESSPRSLRKIERYFFFKHFNLFKKIAIYQRRKFYSLAIDFEDLVWLSGPCISESIMAYMNYQQQDQISKKYTFRAFLIQNYRFKTLDYLKKHVAKKHYPLNKSQLVSTDSECQIWDANSIHKQQKQTQLIIYRFLYVKYFGQIKSFSAAESRIWKMKMNGYKLSEISVLTNTKYCRVDNTIQKILRLMRNSWLSDN